METYDIVTADTLEIGDFISVDGEPVEIKAILDSDDPDAVTISVYSYEDNDTRIVELPYDYPVSLVSSM